VPPIREREEVCRRGGREIEGKRIAIVGIEVAE